MQAGAVNIKLMADIMDLQEKMRRVPGIVGGAMDSIKSSVDMAKAALAGLGILGAAVAFSGLVHGAIETADALNKLAQRTGISTESLSQLQYAAQLADVSSDSLSTGIKKLSQSMAAAAAGDKEKVAQFQALGIVATTTNGVLKSSDDVLLEIADAFAKSRDGAGKTAAAVALLGKAGDEMIPLLNGGAQAVRDLMQEADKLGLTIGTDFAAASEEFNDNLSRLHISSQKLAVSFAGNFVEGLGKAMKAMADASIEGGKLSGVMAGLGTFIFGDSQHQANVAYVGDMEKLMAAESALAKARANNNESEIARLTNLVSIRKAAFEKSQQERKAIEDADEKSKAASDVLNKAHATGPDIKMPGSSTAAAAAESDYAKLIKRIQERIDLSSEELKAGRALTEEEKFAIKVHEDVANAKQKLTAVERKRIDTLLEQSSASAKDLEIQRALDKAAEQFAKDRSDQLKKERDGIEAYMQAQSEATAASYKSIKDRITGLQNEELALTMVRDQNISLGQAIEQLALVRLQEKQAGYFEGSEGYAALQKEIDARKELIGLIRAKDVRDEWTGIWASIDGTAHDVFVNIFDGGQSAFKKLANVLKGSLLDLLYQLTFKKWIVNIGASVTGGAGNLAGASSGGAGGLLNSLGNIPGLSSLVTGGSAFTGALGSGFSLALNGGMGAALDGGVAMLGSATGLSSTLAGLGQIAGALGPIALGVVGVAALASMFDKGGGPKQTSVYGAGTGYLLDQDPDAVSGGLAQATVQSIESGFKNVASALGIRGDLQAGVLTSADPQGDAQTMLAVQAYLGGNRVYSRNDRLGGVENVGRTEEELTKEITAETIRAVYAGLQASDLSQQMKDYLSGIDIGSDSAVLQKRIDELVQVKQLADAYGNLNTNISKLFATNTAASQALIAAFGGVDAFTSQYNSYIQNFYSADEIAAMNLAGLTKAVGDLGYALPNSRAGLRALIEAQDVTTASGAATARTLIGLESSFAAAFPAADALSESLANVTEQLKAAAAARLEGATNNADAAYAALERAVGAQSALAASARDEIRSVFDAVKGNAQSLYASVGSTSAMQAFQGQAFITQALTTAQSTGKLPDATKLSAAIGAARSGVENGVYSSQFEADFARLSLAGTLSGLEDISGGQLDAAQATVDNLAKILDNAKAQLDAAKGIDNSVQDMVVALGRFEAMVRDLLDERFTQGLPTGSTASTPGVQVGGGGVAAAGGAGGVTARYADNYATGGYGTIQSWITDVDRIGRLDSIKAYIDSTFDGTDESIKAIASAAAQYGVSEKDIAAASGYYESDIQKLFARVGVPAFAAGGYHAGGLAMVGENGPELVNFGQPSMIYNTGQTGNILGGGTDRLEALVETLVGKVERLESALSDVSRHTRRSADLLDSVTEGGNEMRVAA